MASEQGRPPWRFYYHVSEVREGFQVVPGGVARPEQEVPREAHVVPCQTKEESIWLYRTVRNRIENEIFPDVASAEKAVAGLLQELRAQGIGS